MNCRNCGKEMQPSWKICPFCEAKLPPTSLDDNSPSISITDGAVAGGIHQNQRTEINEAHGSNVGGNINISVGTDVSNSRTNLSPQYRYERYVTAVLVSGGSLERAREILNQLRNELGLTLQQCHDIEAHLSLKEESDVGIEIQTVLATGSTGTLPALEKDSCTEIGQRLWSPQVLEYRATRNAPALAAMGGRLYAAWRGSFDDNIRWSSFDEIDWSASRTLADRATRNRPALSALGSQLYMVWRGLADDNIWWSSFDGRTWSSQQTLSDRATKSGPALAVLGKKLYMAWQGLADDNIWWSSFDGRTWSAQRLLSDRATKSGPALAAFENQLHMAWRGFADDNIWWSFFDGKTWSAQRVLSDRATKSAPALATFGNGLYRSQLYMAWRGLADDNIWWSRYDGTDWSAQQVLSDRTSKAGPALSALGSQFYMTWQGLHDDNIWWSSLV